MPLGISSLLLLLIDGFVDIVDDESSFQFSPEAEFTPSLYFHITLATGTEAESTYFEKLLQRERHIKILSIQIVFKRIIA